MGSAPAQSVGSPGTDGDLDAVRRIVLGGLRGLRARVFLFGSRARGDHRATSDIDVAILPLEPIPPGVLAGIRETLEESHVPFFVDLIDLSEAPSGLREQALREGIEWTDSAID